MNKSKKKRIAKICLIQSNKQFSADDFIASNVGPHSNLYHVPIISSSNNKRHNLNAINQMFQIACVPLKIKTNLRIYYSRWKRSWKLLL